MTTMSAESPRHVRSGGPLTVPSQPPSDRSIIDAVSGFINDVTLSSSSNIDPKDVIQWARFETADINEPTPEGDSDNDISPLLLILGYGSGVQVWLITPNGDAQEVLSWRQGTVRVLRILPTPQHGDCFASKRPLIALCDSASPGPTFCSLSFISIRGGEQVKSIKFKNPILDVLANKRSVVVSFSERFAVFDAATLEDRMAITTCYPCPCPLGGSMPINPLTLGDRWLAYADKKLNQSKRSSGGCEGEGVTSYTATVLHAAKSLSKGLRGLGESVAHSLAGGRSTSQSPSPPNADIQQPGVVTIIDIEGNDEEDGQDSEEPWDPMVAHFVAHSEAVIALKFDASGMLLVTADRRGHDFHVFRINPHPCGPSLASVHHLYILHRGDTTAKVQDIAISLDSRWTAISTLRGTTHVFAISPYGGPCGVRTHTQPRVVNRLSRFHRSAGLPIHAAHATPKRPSGSPVGDGLSAGSWFPNPRLPPYPQPTTAAPLSQLRPTANLPTHTITRTSSGRQRLSSLSEDSNSAPLLARARFGLAAVGSGALGRGAPAPVTALYLVTATGTLLNLLLHPRALAGVPKEKVCDESPIELHVESVAQWALQRPAAAADLLAPLPPANPLLRQNPAAKCADICMSEEERWLSQVEIVTHAGPHRRLWMGPQFVFKTYNFTGSNSSLSEAETVEVDPSAARGVARSTPVNMPGVRPVVPVPVPVLVDSGSASSVEHSPSDSFRRKSLLSESGRAASMCDVQLREDLAEAMKEDHGWLREESAGSGQGEEGGARGGVARSVDPLGCVVAARAAARPPPLDADAHTRANSDEATFRPVVRAPAALPPAAPPLLRPLPRTTTIPVQPLPAPLGEPPAERPAHALDTRRLIPAELHAASLPRPRPTPADDPTGADPSSKFSFSDRERADRPGIAADAKPADVPAQSARARLSDECEEIETRAPVEPPERGERTKSVERRTEIATKRSIKSTEPRAAAEAVPESLTISASGDPGSEPAADDLRACLALEKDEQLSKSKNKVSSKEEHLTPQTAKRSGKPAQSRDDTIYPMTTEVTSYATLTRKLDEASKETNSSAKISTIEENNTGASKTTTSTRRSDKLEKSSDLEHKTTVSVVKDTCSMQKIDTSSKDKMSTAKSSLDQEKSKDESSIIISEKEQKRTPSLRRSIKSEKSPHDIGFPVKMLAEGSVLRPLAGKPDMPSKDNIAPAKSGQKQDKSNNESSLNICDKEQKNTIAVKFNLPSLRPSTKSEKSADNIDYPVRPIAENFSTGSLIEKSEKLSKERVLPYKLSDRVNENKIEPVVPMTAVIHSAKPSTWAHEDIKTEDQAWDMLLNEHEKPTRPSLSPPTNFGERLEDPKPKSRKNRKIKKIQEDVQASVDEDSFVEIHAIEEKQQVSCGDLVSISSPFEDVDTCNSYVAKTKKNRSSKNLTHEKVSESDQSVDNVKLEYDISCKLESNLTDILSELSAELKSTEETKVKTKSNTLIISQSIEIDKEKSNLNTDTFKPRKCKSLSPYSDMRKTENFNTEVKDVYVIDSTKEEFPEIQITRGTKSRKKSPQPAVVVDEKPPVIDKPVKSWSSIAASKNVKKIDDLENKLDYDDKKSDKFVSETKYVDKIDVLSVSSDVGSGSEVYLESSKRVSLQEKLYELCKRRDIMVAECDAPSELNFIEEHHSDLHDLPPLEPLDFGLDDFKLEVMRDSLLDVNETKLTSPICKINIDDILSSIKETTSKVIESSTFNLIELEKVPARKEKGFSVVESHKIITQEIKIDDELKENEGETEILEKSSDDDNTSPMDSDKEDKKMGASKAALPSAKQTAKAKKSRRKKK